MRLALALAVLLAARAEAASFDYLYIEANEGGSSGGHVAIRFGDETYHFQQVPGGLLQLQRNDAAGFVHRYAGIENRPIHVSRVAVSADDYRRLRTVFAERYLREQKLFAYRDALRDDGVVLRTSMRRRQESGASIALRGAGYFLPAVAARSEVLATLRERVESAYGRGALRRLAERLREESRRLAPALDVAPVEVPPTGYPLLPRTYSERYRDLATRLVAIDVLDRAPPLRADARRAGTDAAFVLDATARRSLETLAERLADDLVRLADSDRPDMGLALLIGMARLEALAESVRTGRLVLLDVYPPDSVVVPPSRWNLAALRGLRAEAAADVARSRTRLAAAPTERNLAALEASGNRMIELDGAIHHDAGLRVTRERLEPSRAARWEEPTGPVAAEATLAQAVAAADAARGDFESALREQLGYDLLTHNCVSELLRTIATAGVRLGAEVGSPWSLDFIPFMSARGVEKSWDVVERPMFPSYRQARLQSLVRRDGWPARLRESNVVTSSIYRWNEADSAFLFFTDDTVVMRPVLGAANLATGFGAAVAGLMSAPLDGARLLGAGLRGVMYSVPELAFVNVRKGSFDYVPMVPNPDPAGAALPLSEFQIF